MNNLFAVALKHFSIFCLVFAGLLIWIYFGFGREKMGDFYRANGNYWLSDIANGGEAKMDLDDNPNDQYDTLISLTSKQQKKRVVEKARREGRRQVQYSPVKFPVDSWANSCLFFVFFIALMIAAPVTIKRKLIGLIFGLPLVYVFIYIKIYLCILFRFSQYYEKFEVGFNSPFMLTVMNYIYNIVMYPFFGLMITLLICLGFVFIGKKDGIKLNIKNNTVLNAAI